MESKEGCEDPCNTTEEETLAYQRKRSRRVSFADITSVHVFDRDEDLETPPDSKPSSEIAELAQSRSGDGDSAPDSGGSKEQSLHHYGDVGEGNGCGNDNGGDEEDEDEDGREPFVRNMDFSSPGSTVGSAASNDEDNFFGPVSASFIRSGRLSSESAASDYNHDVTMDSTAFSLHFRSLMQSDEQTNNLGGNFKTPTQGHIVFEEKTPTGDSMPTNAGSFVLLTGIKRLIPQCPSNERSSVGGNSDDMSLIVEDLQKYDYGRLSPSLDALLTEGQKDCSNKGDTIQAKVPSMTSNNSSVDHYNAINNDQFDSSCCLDKMILPDDGAIGNHCHIRGESTKKVFYCMGKELHRDTPEAGRYLARSVGKLGTSPNKHSSADLIVKHDHGPGGYTKERSVENNYCLSPSSVTLTKTSALTPSNDLDMSVASPKERRYTTDDCQKAGHEPQTVSPESACSQHDKRQFLFYDGHASPSNRLERSAVPSKERKTPDDGQNADKNPQASSQDSAFSLRVKRQRLFRDADGSFSSKLMCSPFPRGDPYSFSNEEDLNAAGVVTSIKNITSKPTVCEAYRVENSDPIFCDLIGNSSMFKDNFGKSNEDPRPSATFLEVVERHTLDAAEKNVSLESVIKRQTADSKSPKRLGIGSGDCQAPLHDGECKKQVDASSLKALNNSQDRKLTVASLSSFGMSGIEKDKELQPSSFHFPIEDTMSTPSPNFTIDKIMSTPLHNSPQLQRRAAQKEINQADGLLKLSSPAKRLDQKISASGWQKDLLRTPNQQWITDKLVAISPGREMQETRTGANADLLTTVLAVSQLADINSAEWKCSEQKKTESKSLHNSLQKEFDLSWSCQTPLSSRVLRSSQFHSEDRYLSSRKDLAKLGEMILPEVELKASVCESAPPEVSIKSSMEIIESPHGKEIYCLADGDGLQHLSQKDLLSPIVLPDLRRHDHGVGSHVHHTLQGSLSTHDIDCSGYKRSQEISSMDREQINGTSWNRKRSRQATEAEDNNSHSAGHVASAIEADKIGGDASQEHWKDVFSKFSAATEQLLPTSVDKLTTQEIGIVEDMLGELLKAIMFEKLCSEIKSQKTMHHHLGKMQQERAVEATWLQHRLIYERAKLQLLHAKRDRLLRNVEPLKLGVQECCNIQSTMQNHVLSTREVHNQDVHVQPLSTETDSENQGAYHTLTTMKKEHGVLELKVKRLIKYFHSSLKLKGEPGNAETIALVNDHLQKQDRSMLLRQYLQLCILDGIQRNDDQRNIVLNYCGLISQRFTMKKGPVSSTTSINFLNDANIRKSFPNMEVSAAFEFVFNAKNGNWIGSPRSFLQVIEATGFLLGSLLDVVEEAQVARLELPNLISTNFHSPCVGQLELQLCFINFSTGRKATLQLDMSGLKCGIYPSEILPSQLKVQISGKQTGASLSSQILYAIQGLKDGCHSTIINLCHSVSKVVQAST